MESSARGRAEPDNDKEAVSDVSITTGLDEPELFSPAAPRPRRFARRPHFIATPVHKPAEITEGDTQGAVNVREGLYRRTLAVAVPGRACARLARSRPGQSTSVFSAPQSVDPPRPPHFITRPGREVSPAVRVIT